MDNEHFQKIIQYYYNCVQAESTLENGYNINPGKNQCLINSLQSDVFIFNKEAVNLNDKGLFDFLKMAQRGGKEVFYGYPTYLENYNGNIFAFPVFFIKLKIDTQGDNPKIDADESGIKCNIKVFENLGYDFDDIIKLQEEIDKKHIGQNNLND